MYQLVQRDYSRSADVPMLSIQRGGKIGLNGAAFSIFSKLGAAAVWIFYDPEARMVGLRAALQPDKNAHKLYKNRGNGSGSITATTFIKAIGWKADHVVTLSTKFNEKERMLEGLLPIEYLPRSSDDAHEE